MPEQWFFTIQQFMIDELHLSGVNLIIFAYIYSFQNGYYSSLKQLSTTLNISREAASKSVNKMIDNNLLEKTTTKDNFPVIKVSQISVKKSHTNVKKSHTGCDKKSHGVCKKVTQGVIKSHTDNNIYINNNHNRIHGEYIEPSTEPPTLEKIFQKIKEENLSVDARKFYDYYNSRNWQVNKNAINWVEKLRQWDRTEYPNKQNPKIEERDYSTSFDELIKKRGV